MVARIPHVFNDGVELKRCGKCETYRNLTEFNYAKKTWDNLRTTCKPCLNKARESNKSKKTEYNKEYWSRTKEKQSERKKEWYQNNKEHVLLYNKEYNDTHKDQIREHQKGYRIANLDKIKARHAEWRRRDYADMRENPDRANEFARYKVKTNTGRRIREILEQTKSKRCIEYVGCELNFFMMHLEEQFTEGMTWDNYGEWHLDHVIPCVAFDMLDDVQVAACFSWRNYQPLWERDNIVKKDSYNIDELESYLEHFVAVTAC